ncbi:hypothetical protein BT93_F0406 [Corymbia citriodora subsp. variegata]|nr:hypothetical protein BT93_F0406 [Corymbia citriodora subsp. variegata]
MKFVLQETQFSFLRRSVFGRYMICDGSFFARFYKTQQITIQSRSACRCLHPRNSPSFVSSSFRPSCFNDCMRSSADTLCETPSQKRVLDPSSFLFVFLIDFKISLILFMLCYFPKVMPGLSGTLPCCGHH